MQKTGTVRRIAVAAVLLLVTGALSACTSQSQPQSQTAQAPQQASAKLAVLRIAADTTDGKTMDPDRQYEFISAFVVHQVYETLISYEDSDVVKLTPRLAENWSISADGKEYTFNLRKGVKFASGNPMTADDVKFSFERLANLKDNPAWLMDPVKSVDAVDPSTVKIVLKEADSSFLTSLTSPNFSILDSKAVMAKGGDAGATAKDQDKATPWLDTNSAGTGPFVLTEWTRNSRIVLERNANYWRTPPKLSRVEISHVKDASTQALVVQRGDADVALNLSPDIITSIKNDANIQIVSGNTLDLLYLGMTTNPQLSEPLSKVKVRQAVRAALDYDGIINGLMRGSAVRPAAPIPVGLLGADPGFEASIAPKTNLDQARKLLADAGYPNGFEVKLSYGTGPSPAGVAYDALAQKIQGDLAQVGIKVTLDPAEFSVMLANYRGQKLAMMLAYWVPDFPDPNGWAEPFSFGGAAKRVFYSNDTLKDLVAKGKVQIDAAQRAATYETIQKVLVEDGPWAPLIQAKVQVAVRKSVSGYAYHPMWYVDVYPVAVQ